MSDNISHNSGIYDEVVQAKPTVSSNLRDSATRQKILKVIMNQLYLIISHLIELI